MFSRNPADGQTDGGENITSL